MRVQRKYLIAGIVIVTVSLIIVGIYMVRGSNNEQRFLDVRPSTNSVQHRDNVDLTKIVNRLNSTRYCVKNKSYLLDSNTICLWGYANPLPYNREEIAGAAYNGGSIIVNEHPLLLDMNNGNSLSMRREWWQLSNIISIVSGYNEGEYLILNNRGLWYSTNDRLLHLTDEVFDMLFKYKDTPYGLIDGQIRKGLSKIEHERNNGVIYDGRSPYWSWEPIRTLASSDLTDMYIVDVSVADNGEVLLVDDSYRTHLINSHHRMYLDLESEEYISNTRTIDIGSRKWYHLPIWKIKLGQSSRHFLIFYSHDVALIENDIILYTVSNIKDAIIHPKDKYSIIVVDKYDYIAMYRYGDSNSKAIDIDSNNRKRYPIDGRASALISLIDSRQLFIVSPENMLLRI